MRASPNLKVTWKNVPTRTITAGGVEIAYRAHGAKREHARSGAASSE